MGFVTLKFPLPSNSLVDNGTQLPVRLVAPSKMKLAFVMPPEPVRTMLLPEVEIELKTGEAKFGTALYGVTQTVTVFVIAEPSVAATLN